MFYAFFGTRHVLLLKTIPHDLAPCPPYLTMSPCFRMSRQAVDEQKVVEAESLDQSSRPHAMSPFLTMSPCFRTSRQAVDEQKVVEAQLSNEVDTARVRINEVQQELESVVEQLGEAKVSHPSMHTPPPSPLAPLLAQPPSDTASMAEWSRGRPLPGLS